MKLSSVCCAIVMTVFAPGVATIAQERSQGPAEAGRPPAPENVVRVFPLKHAPAANLAPIMQQATGGSGARVAADERTNSLIVSTDDPGLLVSIGGLILELDIAVEDDPGSHEDVARVFPLQHAVADDGLAEMLNGLFGGGRRTHPQQRILRVAADPSTNQIIAQGLAADLEGLARIIESLDREPTAQGPSGMSVRLLWLVRGLDMPEARPLPADMKPVLAELERIGVGDLRLASQTVVRASVGQSFSANFITSLGEPWRVLFNGVASSASSGQRQLEIMLSARPPDGQDLSLLQTTITTPPGKYVVLCVSPIENLDSAFVIQVMDVE